MTPNPSQFPSTTRSLYVAVGFLASSLGLGVTQAAHVYSFNTGGSSPFTSGGSWTGNGTLQPYQTDGAAGSLSSNTVLVDDFSNGDLFLSDISFPIGTAPAGFTATHSIMINGGTADLIGGANGSGFTDALQLELGSNVTSVMWTTTYAEPLHSKRDDSNGQHPWLGAARTISGTDADLDITISGIETVTGPNTTGATRVAGLSGTILSTNTSPNSPTFVASGNTLVLNTMTNPTGMVHANTVILDDTSNPHIDYGGGNYSAGQLSDAMISDGERVLADTIKFTWTPTGGATTFDSGAAFRFTFDGTIGGDALAIPLTAIPEPRRSLLLLGVAVVSLLRRRH